jgi:hypothetical protein
MDPSAQRLEGAPLMNVEIDSVIDDLIEAASIESPDRRAFELDVCRRRLEAKINAAIQEAVAQAWFRVEMRMG